jgi:hypothetical protein
VLLWACAYVQTVVGVCNLHGDNSALLVLRAHRTYICCTLISMLPCAVVLAVLGSGGSLLCQLWIYPRLPAFMSAWVVVGGVADFALSGIGPHEASGYRRLCISGCGYCRLSCA